MTGLYARYMDRWERRLATRDTNRVVRPFEWGTDWLHGIGFPACPAVANGDAAASVSRFVVEALDDSDRFFSYPPVRDFELRENRLTFTSPVISRYPVNNTVHALWFPAPQDRGRALVVLPQWNCGADAHVGLAKLLNRFGISVLRMTMAYHAERKPAEIQRADYHVSSNIGRTIHASRQSIIDARACVDWLAGQGYSRVGILGTSLGSCMAFIAMAHDPRVRVGIFNHVSMYCSGPLSWWPPSSVPSTCSRPSTSSIRRQGAGPDDPAKRSIFTFTRPHSGTISMEGAPRWSLSSWPSSLG